MDENFADLVIRVWVFAVSFVLASGEEIHVAILNDGNDVSLNVFHCVEDFRNLIVK